MNLANHLIFALGLLLLISVLSSALSSRLGAPLLLAFLFVGMAAGSGLGLRTDNYYGIHVLGNLALAVILFDGGLRTHREIFRVGLRPALSLATFGVFITAGVTGLFAAWLLHLSWLEGLLLGAIISSTDAAAVFSILGSQGIALKERVGATLEIESGTNDPMAVFLTITLVGMLTSGQIQSGWHLLGFFVQQMGLGILIGFAMGYALVALLNRLSLSAKGLYPLLALAGGILTFGLAGSLEGSGFLAVYLAGLVLGNKAVQMKQDIVNFHVGLGWLAQIIMFLTLGLLSAPAELLRIAPQGLLIAAALMFVARPLAVYLGLLPFHFPRREQGFIAWMGLRGAVPIILALFPLIAHLPNAVLLFNITFFVVLVSLLIQGWTVVPLARRLELEIPPARGPLQQVDLGIPGQSDFELMGYRLEEDCPALRYTPLDLPLAGKSKLIAILRGRQILRLREAQGFRVDDIAYLLARAGDLPALNRLFNKPPLGSDSKEKRFFGEFVLNGDAQVGDLALLYGLKIPAERGDVPLSDFIAQEMHTPPVVGDQVTLGPVTLVVKDMENGEIKRVGLKLLRSSGDRTGLK